MQKKKKATFSLISQQPCDVNGDNEDISDKAGSSNCSPQVDCPG